MEFRKLSVHIGVAVLAVCLFVVPASAYEISLNLSGATQVKGEGELEAKMTFAQVQMIDKLHSNLEWVTELNVGRLEKPRVGYVVGINLITRVNLLGTGKTSPFVDLGAGVNHFGPHESVSEISGPSQFTLLGGIGFRYRPKQKSLGYIVGYRMTHFSNAGSMHPNRGLNLHTFTIGFQFFKDPK